MATEMMEYRPGKWVKVIDGKIVGRATAKEVAAWRARRGETEVSAVPPTLEVDLDLPTSSPTVEPGHSLDVPLRPAYRRRGRQVEPSRPARAGKPEPAPAGKPDDAIDREMTLEAAIASDRARRARPAQQPAGKPADAIDKDMAVETAVARERAARRRSARAGPKPQDAGGPVMVRRRLPKVEATPARKPQDEPATEDTPLPKQSKSPAKATKTKAPRRRRKATATAPARKKARKAPAAKAPAVEAEAEQAQEAGGAPTNQGPSYWWIHNANRRPVAAFLQEWMPRYQEKFGHEATVILCHEDDFAEVEATGVEAEASPLLQPGHFYFGHEDGAEPPAGRKSKR